MVGLANPASAAVLLSGSGVGNYTITLDPLVFNITAADVCCGTVAVPDAIVIKDFFTAAPGVFGSHVSGNIDFSKNGAASVPYAPPVSDPQGVRNDTFGAWDQDDLYINWFNIGVGVPAFSNGDTLTVSTSNLVFSSTVDLSTIIGPPGTYTAHLVEVGSIMATANVDIVPIPATAWLFASGLGVLGWVRRRSRD